MKPGEQRERTTEAQGARAQLLTDDELAGRLDAWLQLLTGDEPGAEGPRLSRDRGQWRERMSGKDLLCHLLTAQFFRVQDGRDRLVQGAPMVEAVLEDLARQMAAGLAETPAELRALRDFFLALRARQP